LVTYQSKITSKGQITLPAELRSRLRLEEGDSVEFYFDHAGRVCMRPRREGVDDFLASLPPRMPKAKYRSDNAAIAAAIIGRDDRSRPKKRRV
jgi:antitoxin PrlF